MLHVSFAITSEAFADRSKTETRRFWKGAHALKFRPGVIFMGIDKDFRAGGKRLHPAMVNFCIPEPLGLMTEDSFQREGGTRYWPDRESYIDAMGGPSLVPFVLRFSHLSDEDCITLYNRCPRCGSKKTSAFTCYDCGWELK